jgi:AraC-like DNA-binding protein
MKVLQKHHPFTGHLKEMPESMYPLLSSWATPEYREYEFGSLVSQEYVHKKYRIHIFRLDISKPTSLAIEYEPKMALQFMLEGNLQGEVPVLPEKGTCRLINVNNEQHEFYFESGTMEWMLIEWDHSATSDITEDFYNDHELLSGVLSLSESALPYFEVAMDKESQALLESIRVCHHRGYQLRMEFKVYITKLIMNYLNGIEEREGIVTIRNLANREKLLAIIDDIKADPNIHRYMSYYSKKYKMICNDIKEGFSSVFKMTMQNYVERECMTAAKKMLELTDDTIDNIAMQLGYTTKGNFSRAYKNYYGFPPALARKKLR